ncbi:MAG: right-handed parallel beta-helix repeat-containing protein [Sedimentisphaerales bacterium]|jgi:hypothetical protein
MLARKIILGAALLLCIAFVVPSLATTYYVKPDGNDSSDGLSWATAFATIQTGINTTADGDIIEVNEGTYYESINFNGKNVTVLSTNPNNWDVVAATLINGNGATTCVTFNSNKNSGSVLTGITIEGSGNGILCNNTSPAISKCIIRNNTIRGIWGYYGAPTISNNKIYNNGSYNIDLLSIAAGSIIRNNTIYNANYGIYLISPRGAATISNNTIVHNSKRGISKAGGGPVPIITNCIIWDCNDDLFGCSATYSCIENGNAGTGNFSSYPYFANYDGNDFHLTWNSPCMNKGDPNGTYTGQTDIDGENREMDNRVDVGADELNTVPVNLVSNPGFEEGGGLKYYGSESNDIPKNWIEDVPAQGWYTMDSNDKYSGNYSWKFTNDCNPNTYHSTAYSDYISVSPEQTYILSAFIKSEGQANVGLSLEQYDDNNNLVPSWTVILNNATVSDKWTKYSGIISNLQQQTKKVRVFITGPFVCQTGTVWWDEVSLTELDSAYLPPYGCSNEENVAKGIDFGNANDEDPCYNGGIVWNSSKMGPRATESGEGGLTYRKLKAGQIVDLKIPAFNVDSNGIPLTPMLLEIAYKRSATADAYVYSRISDSVDPNYLFDVDYTGQFDPNYQDYPIIGLSSKNDGKWTYVQYPFRANAWPELRALDDDNNPATEKVFTIRLGYNCCDGTHPIDYVTLRKISQDEYDAFAQKQREIKGFVKADLPDDTAGNPSYADPNMVVFVRDIMQPVYKHTVPEDNEPNSINAFSCWGEVEPLSFSIYSKSGVDGLEISVSSLVNSADNNSVISANDISINQVKYNESRLTKNTKYYALVPEYIEPVSSLSVDANSSERIWLKAHIPAENQNLSPGLYKGTVTIARAGQPNVTVGINLTIYDITLHAPEVFNPAYHDPYGRAINYLLSVDAGKVFDAYAESGLEPFVFSASHRIKVNKDQNGSIIFDCNTFKQYMDVMVEHKFVIDKVAIFLSKYQDTFKELYKAVHGVDYNGSDPNLYYKLTDPNFVAAYGDLIEKYHEIGAAYNVDFIFTVWDEPGDGKEARIFTDRLYSIVKAKNELTYSCYGPSCDDEVNVAPDYNTPNGMNIPALTNLVDYKAWSMGNEDSGYYAHNDLNNPNYPGSFGYCTTGHSHLSNPAYNRFLHGLFAFATNATIVSCYAVSDWSNNPYNDYDARCEDDPLSSSPDYCVAFPKWNGDILSGVGGMEAIREGIKDAKYIATLKRLITQNPNTASAIAAQSYLDELKARIDPIIDDYYAVTTELGYYQQIFKGISEINDANDYEAFTKIRGEIAEHIKSLIVASHDPVPDNGEIDVSKNANLSWTAETGATSHDVYFGTTNPPAFQVNQAETIYNPGTLNNGTTYYWRINEKSSVGTTTGDVWSFTTIYTRTLTISSTDGGDTMPSEGAFLYDDGTNANIVATADAHYHFVNWTGTAVTAGKVANPTSANTTVTMDADYTVTANFAIDIFTITGTVTSGGSGLSGVKINGPPGNPVTNSSGVYTATVNYGFNGTATPTLADYTFSPATRTYTDVTSNQTARNYTATSTPPTYFGSGTVTSGTGAITPALPSGIASGDILLLFLETSNQAISISNSNGGTWTAVTNSPQSTGTAAGTIGVRLTVFWSRYNGTQGVPTTSDSGDHQLGRIIAIRGAVSSGNPWDVTAGGVEAVSYKSGSIPGATTTVANTLVVTAIATALPHATGTSNFSSWTNSNLSSLTERTDNTVTAGSGGGLGIATGTKATAGAYGSTSVTCAHNSYKAMMSIAIKP